MLPKLAPRGIIVADNLFRDSATLPPATDDEATRGVLDFAAGCKNTTTCS